MSHATHANAALTPRARLRLARLIVDEGWPIRSRRRAVRRVVADREEVGRALPRRRAGRDGRPVLATAPPAEPDPGSRWCARSCTCGGSNGWVRSQIADRLGMPASTVHAVLVRCRLNRLTHIDRATGEPIRRYEHERPATCSTSTSRSSARSPTAAAGATSGTQQGDRNRAATAARTGAPQSKYHQAADRHLLPAHRHRRPLPRRLRRGPRRRDQGDRRRGPAQRRGLVRRPRRHRRSGSCPTTAAATGPTCGATPAPSSASPTSGPGPTGPRPTARSNGSTAPWPRAGHSRSSTTPNQPASPLCQHGSTSTTTTGPTQPSARPHPSPG